MKRSRPHLHIELEGLGVVDPFSLQVCDPPAGDAGMRVRTPDGRVAPLGHCGLHVLGAAQALLSLSGRWMQAAGYELTRGGAPWPASGAGPGDPLGTLAGGAMAGGGLAEGATGPGSLDGLVGEVRLVVRRREARLLGSLLRRHLRRLPEPPEWMVGLSESFTQIDEFLRWEL